MDYDIQRNVTKLLRFTVFAVIQDQLHSAIYDI